MLAEAVRGCDGALLILCGTNGAQGADASFVLAVERAVAYAGKVCPVYMCHALDRLKMNERCSQEIARIEMTPEELKVAAKIHGQHRLKPISRPAFVIAALLCLMMGLTEFPVPLSNEAIVVVTASALLLVPLILAPFYPQHSQSDIICGVALMANGDVHFEYFKGGRQRPPLVVQRDDLLIRYIVDWSEHPKRVDVVQVFRGKRNVGHLRAVWGEGRLDEIVRFFTEHGVACKEV